MHIYTNHTYSQFLNCFSVTAGRPHRYFQGHEIERLLVGFPPNDRPRKGTHHAAYIYYRYTTINKLTKQTQIYIM